MREQSLQEPRSKMQPSVSISASIATEKSQDTVSCNDVNLDIIKNWFLSPAPIRRRGQLSLLLCVCAHTCLLLYLCIHVCTRCSLTQRDVNMGPTYQLFFHPMCSWVGRQNQWQLARDSWNDYCHPESASQPEWFLLITKPESTFATMWYQTTDGTGMHLDLEMGSLKPGCPPV